MAACQPAALQAGSIIQLGLRSLQSSERKTISLQDVCKSVGSEVQLQPAARQIQLLHCSYQL